MYEKELNIEIDTQKTKSQSSIDQLLGPEDNFPFLPDNHRDNSNPIGRIGRIRSSN